jgi:hypothetical protein
MSLIYRPIDRKRLLSVLLILSLALFAACTSSSDGQGDQNGEGDQNMEEMEGMEGMEHEAEGEHEEGDHEEHDRIPNKDGAAISILSPADGAVFSEGDEILVEVEVMQFALGEDGSHWHVYVDGTSWGMVMGGSTTEALRGIEPGEHKLEVYLAGGDHLEFEDGDAITVTVE